MKLKIKKMQAPLRILLTTFAVMLGTLYTTAQTAPAEEASSISNPAIIMSAIVILALALVIAILGYAVIAARSVYRERMQAEKERAAQGGKISALLVAFFLLQAGHAAAQQTTTTVNANLPTDTIAGLSSSIFYLIIGVLLLELITIIALVNILKFLTGVQSKPLFAMNAASKEKRARALSAWWNKINRSVTIEKEKDIDLSHDYDGIRELDNSVPPWWKWAFIATIFFGAVYIWRYHISNSAPLQEEELNIALRKADSDKQAYLKMAASKVDENTVKMLDADGIASGKSLYNANCVACHGNNGEGNVGPNLTDAYWLHKGSINDIFKTIKYGWVDKGMKSWKDDFTPTQIAQLASFVRSLQNTHPANAKEPQGELYTEPADADTVKAAKDAALNK